MPGILGLLVVVVRTTSLHRVHAKRLGDVAKDIVIVVEVVIDARVRDAERPALVMLGMIPGMWTKRCWLEKGKSRFDVRRVRTGRQPTGALTTAP